MNTRIFSGFSVAVISVALFSIQAAEAQTSPTDQIAQQRALLDQYCVSCHNARTNVGEQTGLFLDEFDLASLRDHTEIGENILRKVSAGLMPPSGARRPSPEELASLVKWMEDEIDGNSEIHLPAPGLHRLNRAEYTNAIRDLIALEIDAADFLPSDDSSHGFDNMAGTLTMSPALMEAYLSAAGKISRLAIRSETAPTMKVFDAPLDTAQNNHVEGLPFGTRGGLLLEHEFPADGEYVFTVKGMTGYFTRVLGNVGGEQLEITIDGERVYIFDWDEEISPTEGAGGRSPAIPIKAGFHTVGVTFLATNDLPDTEINRPFMRTMNSPGFIPGFNFYPHVGQVFPGGPVQREFARAAPGARTRSSFAAPKPIAKKPNALSEIVSTLVQSAFRRPPAAGDIELLMDFFDMGREEGQNFDSGIEAALERILADPEFIYRAETRTDPTRRRRDLSDRRPRIGVAVVLLSCGAASPTMS